MENSFNLFQRVAEAGLIGQILLKKGFITSQQLDAALKHQQEKGGMLGDILLEKGWVSEEAFCAALASQSELVYLPIERYKITKDILKLITKEIAHTYCAVPLEKIGGTLTVAIANPLDQNAIRTLENITHYRIVTVIATKQQIQTIIAMYY